jgi:hypothetical protein
MSAATFYYYCVCRQFVVAMGGCRRVSIYLSRVAAARVRELSSLQRGRKSLVNVTVEMGLVSMVGVAQQLRPPVLAGVSWEGGEGADSRKQQ